MGGVMRPVECLGRHADHVAWSSSAGSEGSVVDIGVGGVQKRAIDSQALKGDSHH